MPISIPLELSLFLDVRLMATISATKITKMIPIRSKNGISEYQILDAKDNGIVSKAATSAALPVVLFQNRPRKKMANTPGVIKLEYSCTN